MNPTKEATDTCGSRQCFLLTSFLCAGNHGEKNLIKIYGSPSFHGEFHVESGVNVNLDFALSSAVF